MVNMDFLIVLQPMVMILILVFIGYAMARHRMLDERTRTRISAIIVNVCNPAVILSTIFSGEITATHRDLVTALITAAVLYAVLCLLGTFLPRLIGIRREEQHFYHMMTVYTNVGFMGIPVAQAILSENAMLYVIICNIMFCMYFYTHGIMVLSGRTMFKLPRGCDPKVHVLMFSQHQRAPVP